MQMDSVSHLWGERGDLSLWWDDSIRVEIMKASKHFIDAKCSSVD